MDEGGLASLEEERRLAYVAITRARRRATIFHAANRRIYGQWTSSIPSRFVGELPKAHIDEETTMTGGESLWRARWSERSDPFAHGRQSRARRADRAGSARAAAAYNPEPQRVIEARASAVSLGNKGRDDLALVSACFTASSATGLSRRWKAISSKSISSTPGVKRCWIASSAPAECAVTSQYCECVAYPGHDRAPAQLFKQLDPSEITWLQTTSPGGMFSPSTKTEIYVPGAGNPVPSI